MEMHAMEILQLWGLTLEKNAATSCKKKKKKSDFFFVCAIFTSEVESVLSFVFFDCLFLFFLLYVCITLCMYSLAVF